MLKVLKETRSLLISILSILILPLLAVAQAQTASNQAQPNMPGLDDIAISPSRIELPMMPGTEKTIVVNLIYSSDTGRGQSTRVVAYLGDWDITKEGKVDFYPAGSRPGSASPWLVYSPTEVTVEPGKAHPIRVTISVPKDATPGDHLAALFVEPRPDNIKLEQNRKQVRMKFRLAAVFYIMVPNLTQNASLENLKVEAIEKGVVVTPGLKNEGNSHVRPVYSIKLLDQTGVTMAAVPETESLPVLAGSEMEMPILIETALPAGNYSVQYRVKFGEARAVTEGHAELLVKDHLAQKPVSTGASASQSAKPGGNLKK
jgi:hypothetical protein